MSVKESPSSKRTIPFWLFDILLIVVLALGAYLRTAGLYWGEYKYLHPDERFLVWVGTDISPKKLEVTENGPEESWITVSDYFNTATSPLNPNNRGHGFYVYGTLPMFLTRFAVEWIYGHSGFDVMTQAGRALSTVTDLLTVLLVYLIAARIYDRRVGLLAAAFSTAAVLQIQQSHFFTTDTFSTFFAFLAFYFAVRIMTDRRTWPGEQEPGDNPPGSETSQAEEQPPAKPGIAKRTWGIVGKFFRHPLFWPSLAFGISYGMAMASKINIYPIAFVLPAAILVRIMGRPRRQWVSLGFKALIFLVLAGGFSLVVFRLTQPYAFSGPGILGIKPNPAWVEQILSQRSQASLDVDFPPAMQWARRPVWFSGQNLVIWGLGIPLGLLAWAGFIWAGYRIFKGDWQRHILLWGWTGFYFIWQSLELNPTMRYQLPIYPTLVIFAAWCVVALWDLARPRVGGTGDKRWKQKLPRIAAVVIGGFVLIATFAYAFGFIQIYLRPITRIEASRWIYQNAPGAVNIRILTTQGAYNQPISYPIGGSIQSNVPFLTSFKANATGILSEIYFPYVQDLLSSLSTNRLVATISTPDGKVLSTGSVVADFSSLADSPGEAYTLSLDTPIPIEKDREYILNLEVQDTPPPVHLTNQSLVNFLLPDGQTEQQPLFPIQDSQWIASSATTRITAKRPGAITAFFLPTQTEDVPTDQPVYLQATFRDQTLNPEPQSITLEGRLTDNNGSETPGYLFTLSEPLPMEAGESFDAGFVFLGNQAALGLSSAVVANEGEWDDPLPVGLDGYSPWGGIYPQDINLNMYWEDTPEKVDRFVRILDQSDYVIISSNRQWGSLPRIPERFPMTTAYYRSLLGCPPDKDIVWCYRVAEPGKFEGNLGFELVKTFQSNPGLGPIEANDQFAEEAFTVYDHPKVLIFRKTDAYDPQKTRDILESVDLSRVVRLPPLRFENYPASLTLPIERWTEQIQGGTWSEIFNSQALQNRYQGMGVLIWYVALALLGLICYPILRLALPGLPDGAYPLARTAGLLILSYLVWIAGSFRVPFTRTTISVALLFILTVGILLAYHQRNALRSEWKDRKTYFLIIEGLFLAFFLIDLFIRLGNPDLWHPYKGGEKPMDFAYLNAILKSTSFPPYDPWYAGGYLNYYYYGFLLLGVLVKWLGITPAFAYNLILPTVFAMIAMGAFSIAWNIYKHMTDQSQLRLNPIWVGLASAVGMAIAGNLGTLWMVLFRGYQRLAAPDGVIDGASIFSRIGWTFQGLLRNLSGTALPYSLGDWYWIPSRVIPGQGDIEPITEFPFFTVLYADPHAHLYALPIALLCLGFALSLVLAGGLRQGIARGILTLFIGAVAIGALRPTNTWDFYTYLAFCTIAMVYASWRLLKPLPVQLTEMGRADYRKLGKNLLLISGQVLILVGLSYLLYQPYSQWYGAGYREVEFWQGPRTPLYAYFLHWGVFLFIIISWMVWETRDWLSSARVSQLRRLNPYKVLLISSVLLLIGMILLLSIKLPGFEKLPVGKGVTVALVSLPLAAWAGVLILRPGQTDARRFTLFMFGTGMVLTLVVEIIRIAGDIGRMNTVFKFYLQVWTLLAVCAAVALGWLISALPAWTPRWRWAWGITSGILIVSALLYPLTATRAKILDRMVPDAPHTLDGMQYMESATYDWGGTMDLSQDYRAIRWMQENIKGSPVIVEANLRELYRWGSRFSIYTGLPGVVGWEWHQQQQRALNPGSWVSERISDIETFYTTTDPQVAQDFLNKYGVKYIILGQLERNQYPGAGLDKFEALNGLSWREVYRDRETVIFEVINADRS